LDKSKKASLLHKAGIRGPKTNLNGKKALWTGTDAGMTGKNVSKHS
jgi:hypothetical protein